MDNLDPSSIPLLDSDEFKQKSRKGATLKIEGSPLARPLHLALSISSK